VLTGVVILLVLLLSTTPVTVVPEPLASQPTPAVDALVPVPLRAFVLDEVLVPTTVLRLLLLAVMDVVVPVFVLVLVLVFDVAELPPPHPVDAMIANAISVLVALFGK
jgi:hypothetical protein